MYINIYIYRMRRYTCIEPLLKMMNRFNLSRVQLDTINVQVVEHKSYEAMGLVLVTIPLNTRLSSWYNRAYMLCPTTQLPKRGDKHLTQSSTPHSATIAVRDKGICHQDKTSVLTKLLTMCINNLIYINEVPV